MARTAGTLFLLLAGIPLVYWICSGKPAVFTTGSLIVLSLAAIVAIAIGLSAPLANFTSRSLNLLRSPSARARTITASILGLAAGYYLLETASAADRQFKPVLHDEYAYTIQTRMAAAGRLWMPRHELADHLQSFHLVTQPVYTAKYSPGTALLCAPAIWLGLPPQFAVLALTAGAVALMYLVATRWIDGLAGIFAALMLPALPSLRRVSVEMLSQGPMLFLALLAVYALLRWRPRHCAGWLTVAWAAIGGGILTRPLEGASLAFCAALAMTVELFRSLRSHRSEIDSHFSTAVPEGQGSHRPRILLQLLIPLLALAPFAVVQLAFNRAVTGSIFDLPWSYYSRHFDPHDTPSLAPLDPSLQSESPAPNIREFARRLTEPAYEAKLQMSAGRRLTNRAIAPALRESLPSPMLLMLVPVGLMALAARGRWVFVLFAALPVYVYSRHTFVLPHYFVPLAPAFILLALAGWDGLARIAPPRASVAIRAAGAATIAGLSIAALPQFQPALANDEFAFARLLRFIDDQLAEKVRGPAVVLFRADASADALHIEPVYNTESADIDSAPVIRLHDLGPANRAVYSYYARLSQSGAPDRGVYLYDYTPGQPMLRGPQYIGTASELARGR